MKNIKIRDKIKTYMSNSGRHNSKSKLCYTKHSQYHLILELRNSERCTKKEIHLN